MQFIPSTWSVVGVDADGDGQRNPQDIDDAALATAVYLCSGDDDLSTDAGQRAAVYRYNHSQAYVDLVLAIMTAYLAGDFTVGAQRHRHDAAQRRAGSGAARAGGDGGGGGGGSGLTTATPLPTSGPTGKPSPATDRQADADPDRQAEPNGGAAPAAAATDEATRPRRPARPRRSRRRCRPRSRRSSRRSCPPPCSSPILTLAEAIVQCTAQGLVDNPLDNNDAFDQCVAHLTGG